MPQTAEASNYLRMLGLCDDAMFFVFGMSDDGAFTVLFVSPGVTPLLGFTQEEYLALGCAAPRPMRRGCRGSRLCTRVR